MSLHQLSAGNESNAPLVERARQNGMLHGRWLLLARCAGAILTVFLLVFFIANLPVYFVQLQTVCVHALCPHWQLTPANARAFQNDGLSVSLYAIFSLALSLFSALVWFAVAAFIAWRKSNDWMALLTSLFLVTAEVLLFSGGPLPPLEYSSPAWHVPTISLFLLLSILYLLVFSLFPNGRFVPGWMRWLVTAQIVLGAIVLCLPTSFSTTGIVFTPLNTTLLLSAWAIIIGGQMYRYQHVSSPTERQQTKWVVFGLIVGPVMGSIYYFSPLVFPSLSGSGSIYFLLFNPVFIIASLFSPLCFGIAILRYRLWDVDIIINRTLVYGVLTVSIVALYVLVVVGLGALLQAQGNLGLSLLATGLIAVLFHPLRSRLQRAVNRLMYGERDDPYRVISRMGQRLEATLAPDSVLPTIVETVAQALKLPYAAISLKHDDEFTIAASYGSPVDPLQRLPLVYQTEQVGELVLASRTPSESFTSADHRLLNDLARQAGIAAHTVRLTADLKGLTVDLQHSRERLVAAREEERRRLRRDLHDGLGPQLASLTLKLETARNRLAYDPLADTLLSDLAQRTQATVADIRRLVYALRPPTLDELGLVSALRELTLQYSDQVSMRLDSPECLPELPAAVEVAVYRITQEALTNVIRHAQALHCDIRLTLDETTGLLTLSIQDDGHGLTPSKGVGVGLTSMRERAEELGGTWTIERVSTGGTRVVAHLPSLLPSPSSARESLPASTPQEEA
jgi:signal transduction histidine kinase